MGGHNLKIAKGEVIFNVLLLYSVVVWLIWRLKQTKFVGKIPRDLKTGVSLKNYIQTDEKLTK